MFNHHHTHRHHHRHDAPGNEVPAWAAVLNDKLDLILVKMEAMMATLDQILTDVTDEGTRLDSLSTLLDGLRQQLADALSGANLPAPVQAKVDAIFAAAEANKAKIDTALNTGVPAPPVT